MYLQLNHDIPTLFVTLHYVRLHVISDYVIRRVMSRYYICRKSYQSINASLLAIITVLHIYMYQENIVIMDG